MMTLALHPCVYGMSMVTMMSSMYWIGRYDDMNDDYIMNDEYCWNPTVLMVGKHTYHVSIFCGKKGGVLTRAVFLLGVYIVGLY